MHHSSVLYIYFFLFRVIRKGPGPVHPDAPWTDHRALIGHTETEKANNQVFLLLVLPKETKKTSLDLSSLERTDFIFFIT